MIDAFEDYEKDHRRGRFNAFRAIFGPQDDSLSMVNKRRIADLIHGLETQIVTKIELLPVSAAQKSLFISRLSQNLSRKLAVNLHVLPASHSCVVRPMVTFRQRRQAAVAKATYLARNYSWQCRSFSFLSLRLRSSLHPPKRAKYVRPGNVLRWVLT